MVMPGSGKALPGSGLNVRAEVFGNLDEVVGATGVENQAFRKGVELAEAARKVSGLIKAEDADADGEGVTHFEVLFWARVVRRSTVFETLRSMVWAATSLSMAA